MKNYNVITLIVAAMLPGAAPLAAQCQMSFSISSYNDGSVSFDDSTVYGYANFIDNSQTCGRCSHNYYVSFVEITDPNGSQVAYLQQGGQSSSTSAAINGDLGTYNVESAFHLVCSCYGQINGGGPTTPVEVFGFNADMPATLYNLISSLGGGSPSYVQGEFVAANVLNDTNSPITSDNLNILGLGNAVAIGDSPDPQWKSWFDMMGFNWDAGTVPTTNPGPGVIGEIIHALATAFTFPAAAAVVLASALIMEGDKPAGWDETNQTMCEAIRQADRATCSQRFPYGTNQGAKYIACIEHSWIRFRLCMKNQPMPPLQPQY